MTSHYSLLCVTLLVTAAGCSTESQSRPLVATREGLVRGVTDTSAAGVVFYSFLGVRYARPPVGPLRFQPPQRHSGWQDVADAGENGNKCLQLDFRSGQPAGSEDCLFANVHTPRLSSEVGGLPVMVFIHGGSFTLGSGDADFYSELENGPRYFMDEAVVLVTLNYRLGPFGFFTTHDSHAPGNYGLLDQVLLLQWVRDNIASFGGDPRAVTIFGQSAGGASVSLLVLSPLTRGLFHHAITQSGSAISPFAASGRRLGLAEKFAQHLNCTTADVSKMVECLRGAPATGLLDAVKAVQDSYLIHFQPRVDKESESPLLPDDPRTILETGGFNLVPWMSGVAREEALYFLAGVPFTDLNVSSAYRKWTKLADIDDTLDCGASSKEEIDKLVLFYLDDSVAGLIIPPGRMYSDRQVTVALSEEIRLASAHAPVYKYVLDQSRHLLSVQRGNLSATPATHGDDLPYLFSSGNTTVPPADPTAYRMVRFMVSLWTSFARTGRPSSTVLPMPDWPVFTEQSQRHMRLSLQPSLGERLFEERVRLWQSVRLNEPWRHVVQTGPCQCPTPPTPPADLKPQVDAALAQWLETFQHDP